MIDVTTQPKFMMGNTVATPMALEAIEASSQTPSGFLWRHVHGDWGSICDEDKHANDDALKSGARILSAYSTHKGDRLWVITEAEESGHRMATTILLPDEY